MVACVILGDSLAAGVAAFRPDCLADTKVGISTSAFLRTHTAAIDAETVLISLGVNDGEADPGTADRLAGLRLQIGARRVFWILPARPDGVRQIIRDIAQTFGDRLIETRGFTGSDGLHLAPHTYRTIAAVFDIFGRRSHDASAERGHDEARER